MEESNNKEEKPEFLGRKRELPEIKLDSISEYDDEKSEKNLMNDLTKKNQKDNLCKICEKNIDVLKFENSNDILNYLEKENIQIPENLELDRNNNIIFNTIKIICKECFKKILYDKNKYNDFFTQSIEIINEESDDDAEINIYGEQPIIINEVESSKNDNEQKNEEKSNNIILSNSEKESKNNQDKKEEEEKQINNNDLKNDVNINPSQINETNDELNNNNNNVNFQNKQDDKLENDINKNINENLEQKIEQNLDINNNNDNINNNNINQNNQFANLNIGNSEDFQQNIQNLIIQNYLANLNIYKQVIEQEIINSKNCQDSNNLNINPELIQEQQAIYMNAIFQYLSYVNQLYNANLAQNQINPIDFMNLNALYANYNNNINQYNTNNRNNNMINNEFSKKFLKDNNTLNVYDTNINIENSDLNQSNANQDNNLDNKLKDETDNSKSTINYNFETTEKKNLTDLEKCINELKYQITNVNNCLEFEKSYYEKFNDLGKRFEEEIYQIKEMKNKLEQFNINSFTNNNYNQLLLNNIINQNQLYQMRLNYQNQFQNLDENNRDNNNDQTNIANMMLRDNNNIIKNEQSDVKENIYLNKKEDENKGKLNSETNEQKNEELNLDNKNEKKEKNEIKDFEERKDIKEINKSDIIDKNEISTENKKELTEAKEDEKEI